MKIHILILRLYNRVGIERMFFLTSTYLWKILTAVTSPKLAHATKKYSIRVNAKEHTHYTQVKQREKDYVRTPHTLFCGTASNFKPN